MTWVKEIAVMSEDHTDGPKKTPNPLIDSDSSYLNETLILGERGAFNLRETKNWIQLCFWLPEK